MKSERVEQWLQDIRSLSEERYQLLQSLRQTILALDNTVTEEMKYGGIGRISSVFKLAEHVDLRLVNKKVLECLTPIKF